MKHKYPDIIPTLLLMSFSCGFTGCTLVKSASKTKHVAEQPLRSRSALAWQSIQVDQFMKSRFAGELKSNSVFAPIDPTVNRVQIWLDTFDGLLRAKYGAAFQFVPKPQAVIVREPSYNAHTTSVPFCAKVRIERRGSSASKREVASIEINSEQNRILSVSNDDKTFCNETLSSEEKAEFVTELNRRNSSCTFALEQETITAEGACWDNGWWIEGKTQAQSIMWRRQLNIVFVNSGAFGIWGGEAELAATLAHELGHYYRAHGSGLNSQVSFFFDRRAARVNGLPVPTKKYDDLASKLSKFGGLPIVYKDTTLHTSLFPFMNEKASTISNSCSTASCRNDCSGLATILSACSLPSSFPLVETLNVAQRQCYLGFEDRFLKCAQQLPSDYPIEFYSMKIATQYLGAVQENPQTLTNPKKHLLDLSERFKAADLTAQNLVAEAAKVNLGWYTVEQEADDFAAELLSMAGVDPKSLYQVYFSILNEVHKSDLTYSEYGYEGCKKLFDADWKDPVTGKQVIVPIARWDDTHHSVCYRIFNTYNEMKYHDYKLGQPTLPLLTATDWAKLAATAVDLNKGMLVNPELAFGFRNF